MPLRRNAEQTQVRPPPGCGVCQDEAVGFKEAQIRMKKILHMQA